MSTVTSRAKTQVTFEKYNVNKWSDGIDYSIAIASGENPLPAVRSPELLQQILTDRFRVIPDIITTAEEAKLAQAACGEIRAWRAAIENRRKDLKQASLDYGRMVDEESERWKAVLDGVQKPIAERRKVYEDAKERERQARLAEERRIAEERAAQERQAAIAAALAEAEAKRSAELEAQRQAAAKAAEQVQRAEQEAAANRQLFEQQQQELARQKAEFVKAQEELQKQRAQAEAEAAVLRAKLAELQKAAEAEEVAATPRPFQFHEPIAVAIDDCIESIESTTELEQSVATVDTVPQLPAAQMPPIEAFERVISSKMSDRKCFDQDAAALRGFADVVRQAWESIPQMQTGAGHTQAWVIGNHLRKLLDSISEGAIAIELTNAS